MMVRVVSSLVACLFLLGGGMKGGSRNGATDDYERITYRHARRDFCLTDDHGHVVRVIQS